MSPMDRGRYPRDWPAISRAIRERAGNRCEWCGVANHAIGARDIHGDWHDEDDIEAMNSSRGAELFGGEFPKIIRIVLTVAHLDHDPANNDPSNLAALCQLHHLRHDSDLRRQHAAETRRRRKVEAGQVNMFAEANR